MRNRLTWPLLWIARKTAAGLLFAATLVLLTLAQLVVQLVPFRRYAWWLRQPTSGPVAPLGLVRSLRRKIHLASRTLPWHPPCLPQALVARLLLSACGYSSVLSLGVREDGAVLAAHAWLKSGDLFVCGKAEAAAYGEVARF